MSQPPKRVFLSHTSEFQKYPEKKSFINSAEAGVISAKCMPCDMQYFTARDEKPAAYCKERVRECDIYVGILGLRYGSPVRDRPEVSYTELEFEAACEPPAKTRLVFVLDELAEVPVGLFSDNQYGGRQAKFRKRISDAGVMCAPFRDAYQLEKLIYQALVESEGAGLESQKPVRIDWDDDKSPYPGLLSFDEIYAPLFFGREREVDAVVAKMSEPQGRFLIISGASGSGKSSLVAAGLWRALIKENRLPSSGDWKWLRIQPGDGATPFVSLAWGLKQAFPKIDGRPDDLANALAKDGNKLPELVGAHLGRDREMVLFVDQLEELFTRGFKHENIKRYLEQLLASAGDAKNRLRVLATVRSEFLGRLEESEAILELLNAGYNYHLGPVSPRALQDMIEKPAQATGYEFDDNLVNEVLRDAAQESGALPLVAYALEQLFKRGRERIFTREAYNAIGGVAGAIGTEADKVISALDQEAQGAFDRVFAELVHIERDRPPTKKRATLASFKADEGAKKLLYALAGQECRILVTGEEREPSVQVAHEKLFTAWPKLREWIDKGGDALRLIEHANEAARRWVERGRLLGELWTKGGVDEVLAAMKRFGKTADATLEEFLHPQQFLLGLIKQDALSHDQRARIGEKLAEFGDPREGVGLRRDDGLPDILWSEAIGPGKVEIENHGPMEVKKPFRIAVYPVTYIQFEAFLKAPDGYGKEEWWEDLAKEAPGNETPSWNIANHPRETVSWYEAVAFCRWLTQKYREVRLFKKDREIRLPTEWEWQLAATGGDPKREYPWEGGWDPARGNSFESRLNRTTAVGMYPHGATKHKVLDMAGNAWEWCLNKSEKPDDPDATRIDKSGDPRVFRGGSWYATPRNLRSSSRGRNYPGYRNYSLGFRLVQDIE